MALIIEDWMVSADTSVPSNTISAMASWTIPQYPVNQYPISRNAIFPYLGASTFDFLQPVLLCGQGWNLINGAPNFPGGWGVVGYYFHGASSLASTCVDVSPIGGAIQGYISKSGTDWLCGINAMGSTPLTELPMSTGMTPSAFGCVIEWRGWSDAAGPHSTSTNCDDLISNAINFTQIAVDNGSYPTLSWTTSTYADTGCGTKVTTVNSSANPNGSVTLRAR